jgi:hypothetical protein
VPLELKTREEWLAARKKVITATEAPILLGLNKYSTPAQMQKEKEEGAFTGNAFTIVGNWLEPVVIQATNMLLGINAKLIEENGTKTFYQHDTVALGATPDAFVESLPGFLECKTTRPVNYLKYSATPPAYYVMQLITQLHCANYKTGYLAIMSTDLTQNSPELKIPLTVYQVRWNRKLCEILESEVNRYWKCKEEGKMFKVNSKVRDAALLLISISYNKVY